VTASGARPGLVSAVWRQLCPRCREGAIFKGSLFRTGLALQPNCPVCGLKFQREAGYFIGAMYFSYLISIPPVLALVLVLWRLTGWRYDIVILAAFLCYLPAAPVVTRYARVMWIYVDQHFDPEKS
jgi:uncharacterized protein (DUF983 family)